MLNQLRDPIVDVDLTEETQFVINLVDKIHS